MRTRGGVRKAPFDVLIGATMPSILAEVGFVSNPRDENALKKAGAAAKNRLRADEGH
jgi:N-acetylmuramoyl-L-alanine amidase